MYRSHDRHAIAPRTPPMSAEWLGHHAITRTQLMRLLLQAAAGFENFSREERAFCTACNFRATMANGDPVVYAGTGVAESLGEAGIAFEIVGAPQAARRIDRALAAVRSASTAPEVRMIVTQLAADIVATGESLDELLAEFAGTLVRPAPGNPD